METADKERLLKTFVFETLMAQITRTKAFTRIGPYADKVSEVWGNTVADMEDMTAVAHRVQTTLMESFHMVDMTLSSGPTVDLLLERDLLNAAAAQVFSLVAAKGMVVHSCYEQNETLDDLTGELARQSTEWSLALWIVADAAYYREPLIGLARKMNISLMEDES